MATISEEQALSFLNGAAALGEATLRQVLGYFALSEKCRHWPKTAFW